MVTPPNSVGIGVGLIDIVIVAVIDGDTDGPTVSVSNGGDINGSKVDRDVFDGEFDGTSDGSKVGKVDGFKVNESKMIENVFSDRNE